jgi:acyl carrier protein
MLTVDDVCGLVRKQLGGSFREDMQLGADSKLEELGLSSLQISDIIFTIEEDLGIEFDAAEAAELSTIEELVDMARAAKAAL